jgi:hypothetical protein
METGVAAIAVEYLIDLLIAFSGEADFAICLKERLEFLLRGGFFLFQRFFHVHFHDNSDFHRIIEKLLSFVAETLFK